MKKIVLVVYLLFFIVSVKAVTLVDSYLGHKDFLDLRIQNDILYALHNNGLFIYDVSDGTKNLINVFELEQANSIEIHNDYLYISGNVHLYIINISDTNDIHNVNTINTTANKIIIDNNKLHLISEINDSWNELTTYDNSDPENPILLGSFTVDSQYYIFIHNSLLYFVSKDGYVCELKVSSFNESGISEEVYSNALFTHFLLDFESPVMKFYDEKMFLMISINLDQRRLYSFDMSESDIQFFSETSYEIANTTTNFTCNDFEILSDKIYTNSGDVLVINPSNIELLEPYNLEATPTTLTYRKTAVNNDNELILYDRYRFYNYEVSQEIVYNYSISLSKIKKFQVLREFILTVGEIDLSITRRDIENLDPLDSVFFDGLITDLQVVDQKIYVSTVNGIYIFEISTENRLLLVSSIEIENVSAINVKNNRIVTASYENFVYHDVIISYITLTESLEFESIRSYNYSGNRKIMQIDFIDDKIFFFGVSINENAFYDTIDVFNVNGNEIEFDYNLLADNVQYFRIIGDKLAIILGDVFKYYVFDENLTPIYQSEFHLMNDLSSDVLYIDEEYIYLRGNSSVKIINIADYEISETSYYDAFDIWQVYARDGYYYDLSSTGLSIYEAILTVENDSPNLDSQANSKIMSIKNYPNPFSSSTSSRNSNTTISFEISESHKLESASLNIFNIKGQKVKSLFSNKNLSSGNHSFSWNGEDESGKKQSSGIYFYQLSNKKEVISTNKMMIIK